MSSTSEMNRIESRRTRALREGRRTRRAPARRRGTDRSMEQLFGDALGSTRGKERERRLEEVVLTTWAALASGHPVECPVCGGALTAAKGCRSCGSHLD
jgi:hypothetical protein